MSPLPLDIIVKSSALLAAAAVADAALSRRGSAAARHLVWSIAVVGMLVLPIASSTLPAWQVRIPVTRSVAAAAPLDPASPARPDAAALQAIAVSRPGDGPATPAASSNDQSGSGRRFGPPAIVFLILLYAVYGAGVLMLLARLGRESRCLRRLAASSRLVADPSWQELLDRAARRLGVARSVRLLQSPGELMPMTFRITTPTIVMPASANGWAENRRLAVLLHELAHVARRDCLMQRLAAVACAIYWPHPGVWWAARRLRVERELACDDRVLAAGAGAGEYAGHLLDLARALGAAPAPATALAMARTRQLEDRLVAILDAARNRTALRRRGLAAAVTLSIAALLPMAALRAAVVMVDRPAASGLRSSSPPPDAATPALTAQDVGGLWEIRPSRDSGMVELNLRTLHSSSGTILPLTRLDGLSASQLASGGGTVHFLDRRDAGTFTFDGVCRNGLCAGTYAFAPSQTFAAELGRRGIGAPTPDEQYELARDDVGVAFLDELATERYQKPDVHELVHAARHGVGLDYVRNMASAGYRLGTVQALIGLRDHGVDPEYVRGMAANGFAHLSPDDLLRARDHGVDPVYVKGMRDLGYTFPDLAGLIAARDHGVDPEFARGMAALGFKDLTLEALRTARDHGVDPEYARGMQGLGYRLTLSGLRQARDHGVDPEYARGMQGLGYTGLSVDALVGARDHGVDPEYIRDMAALGYTSETLDVLIRLRDHGIDAAYVRRVQRRGGDHLSVEELIRRRDRGEDDPGAAERATVAAFRTLWRSMGVRLTRISAWLRG